MRRKIYTLTNLSRTSKYPTELRNSKVNQVEMNPKNYYRSVFDTDMAVLKICKFIAINGSVYNESHVQCTRGSFEFQRKLEQIISIN